MKSVSISGSPRANVGKRNSKDIRNEGGIPCVLYGGKEQYHFSVPYNSVTNLIYSPDVFMVDLELDGKKSKAIVQDIQFHTVNDRIIHIDFLELSEDKAIVIEIPVKIVGTSTGVRQGGKLLTPVRKLKVKAFPKDLPDNIEVNVTDLNIGQSAKVGDIKMKGVQFLDAENMVVATVRITRNVVAAAADAPAKGAAPAKAAPAKAAPAKK
jgi:large subunit ribosomal protein L25